MFIILFKEEIDSDDGSHFKTTHKITEEDLRFLRNGWVDIINTQDMTILTQDGEWTTIEAIERDMDYDQASGE